MGGAGSDYWGAQDKSVPMNSGSRPGAPLGGHSTKLPLPEDPVAVAAPAVEVDPPPPPRLPPPPPPPVWPEAPEPVLLLPPVPVVPVVEVVEVVVVVPAVDVEVVPDEFCTLGNATAPPPVGKPLRKVALPTPPVPGEADGVAFWARAIETMPIDRKRAKPGVRIMAGYIMRHCPLCREIPDQTA
jgi:hypothetical protein